MFETILQLSVARRSTDIKQGTLLLGVNWPPSLQTRHQGSCSCSKAMQKTLLDRAAISASSVRLFTEQERMRGLRLCLSSLVTSLVYTPSLAMANKHPRKDLCTRVKGWFQVLLHEEFAVWDAHA